MSTARWVAAAVVAGTLGACKLRAPADADAGPSGVDASDDARQPASSAGPDAAAPPDDEMMPAAAGDELMTRARHLLEAIAQDNVSLASDIIFPRDGWLATRDAEDPGKDWERQVAEPSRKAVHALSRRHRGLEHAQLVALELGRTMTQERTRKHGWKKPLWSVGGSRLTFVVDGHTRTLDIREMVAWRGAWYLTRLR